MYKFDYKKSLGQNFLKDKEVIHRIVDSVNFEGKNLVIEIGPGSGALTKEILNKANFAILYEIDTRLEKVLNKELVDYNNYELIFGDFLEADIVGDLAKYDYDNLYIVANLPYYVTTPIINKIITSGINVKEIVVMVQKEVADRLTALPNTKEYGQITVFLNYFYELKKLFVVSRNSFIPKPKVDSAVIKLTRKDNKIFLKDIELFNKIVKDSFRFKRKTIRNNLVNYNLDKVEKVLKMYGYDLNSRSEMVPYDVFIEIANELSD